MVYLERTSTYPFLAALVAAAVALAFYGALFALVKIKNERASSRINEIEALAKQEGALASVKALMEETAVEREKLSSALFSSDQAVSFIEMLESLARGAGVSLSIGSVEPVGEGAGGGYLRLALRFEGRWHETLHFVGLLELLPLEAEIAEARFFRLRDGQKTGLWRSDAVLRVLQRDNTQS